MNTAPNLDGWVSLSEAAKRLPSTRAGKRTACSTVYRRAVRHGLEIRRQGPYRYVRWEDVLALYVVDVPAPPPVRNPRIDWHEHERAMEYLRERGIA